MDVGMMMIFTSYGWDYCPDGQVWDEELRLARLAADSGFDCLWSAEPGAAQVEAPGACGRALLLAGPEDGMQKTR